MKLASRAGGGPDGRLVLVSRDLAHVVDAEAAPTVQAALDRWAEVEPRLRAQYDDLAREGWPTASPLDFGALLAAMPRSFQFLDASAFLAHNHILAEAWGYEKRSPSDPPLMYQGLSDRFYPARGDISFKSEADSIDFEAEYGVILDDTPLGSEPRAALDHARLVVILNDWSLRSFGPQEMRGGFGFLHAKPPSAMSAIAVTPDELGEAWRDGRVALPMLVHRGEELFGRPDGAAMSYNFGELIAHACATRDLCAGTVVGSGTVSNYDADVVGSGCIAERRALDQLIPGKTPTPFLRFGEQVRLEVFDKAGASVFGSLSQTVCVR